MSIETGTVRPPGVLDRIGGPPTLSMPDEWTYTTAWKRAQQECDQGGPINRAERMVVLSGGEGHHRVTWALKGTTLVAECDCAGHQYHDGWCAHVASLWWQWILGKITVTHLDTGHEYDHPPSWLRIDGEGETDVGDGLTPAELDAYLTCQLGDVGVREYARKTSRSPGTVGNLLRRAREKVVDGRGVVGGE